MKNGLDRLIALLVLCSIAIIITLDPAKLAGPERAWTSAILEEEPLEFMDSKGPDTAMVTSISNNGSMPDRINEGGGGAPGGGLIPAVDVTPPESSENNIPVDEPETETASSIHSTAIQKLSFEEKQPWAEALTCTIKTDGGFQIDMRLRNPGEESIIVTINPPGRTIVLAPNETKRVDIFIIRETKTLIISSNDGEELEIVIPTCMSEGESSSIKIPGTYDLSEPVEITTPVPETEIPEFSWVGFPVISIILLLLIFNRK